MFKAEIFRISLGIFLFISELGVMASQPAKLALSQANKPAVNCDVFPESDETARKFVEKSRQYAFSKKTAESAQSLSQAFKAARNLKNPQIKVLMLEDLIPVNVQPRLVDTIVEQSLASGQKQHAAAVLKEMLQFTQSLGSGYSSIKTRSLAEIGNYYAQLGQVSQARSVLSQAERSAAAIQGAQLKTSALIPIARGYVAAQQPDTAAKILSQSLSTAERIQSPNAVHKDDALQQIAVTYAKIGKFDRAIPVAQRIPNSGFSVYYQSQALAGIASEYIKDAKFEKALTIAQTIEAADTKAKTLAQIAAQYARNNQQQQASQVFSQALAVANSLNNPNISKAGLLADVATEYAKAGQLDAALPIVQEQVDDAFIKAKSLTAFSLLYAKAKQEQQANQLLTQALEYVKEIKEDYRRNDARQEIIRESIEAGQYDEAVQAARTIADEFVREETLQQIALQAVERGNNSAAIEILGKIDKKFVDYRNRVLEKIAIAYAKAGEYDKALLLAADTTSDYRVRTLAGIATQATLAKQSRRAVEIFSQAKQAADTLEIPDSRVQGQATVALEYARTGQQQKATEILSQALQTAQNIKDPSSRSFVLRTITEDYIRAEQFDLAFAAAKAMKDDFERTGKLQEIAGIYLEYGQYEKALQVVNALKAPEYKAKVLVAIANKYIQAKQPSKTNSILASAFQIAKTIPGPESKKIVVKVDTDGQGNVISKTEVDDDYDRGSLLEEVAIGFARGGQYNQALQVSQTLKDAATRQQLRQRLACFR